MLIRFTEYRPQESKTVWCRAALQTALCCYIRKVRHFREVIGDHLTRVISSAEKEGKLGKETLSC